MPSVAAGNPTGFIRLHARVGTAPAPAQPGAGQSVQLTSRALLRWYPGPWVQAMSPLVSLALPPGSAAVGQGADPQASLLGQLAPCLWLGHPSADH